MKTNLFSILCPEIKEQHLTRINLYKFLVVKIRAKEKTLESFNSGDRTLRFYLHTRESTMIYHRAVRKIILNLTAQSVWKRAFSV